MEHKVIMPKEDGTLSSDDLEWIGADAVDNDYKVCLICKNDVPLYTFWDDTWEHAQCADCLVREWSDHHIEKD